MKSLSKKITLSCAFMTLSMNTSFADDAVFKSGYNTKAEAVAYDNYVVSSRARPDYDAKGVKLGAFTARPSLTLEGISNDNIKATKGNKDADLITVITPELDIKSNFNRHELSFSASSDIGRFHQDDNENYENYRTNLDGRIDVLSDFNIDLGLGYAGLTEDRTAALTPRNTVNPIEYSQMGGYLGLNKQFNRLLTQLSADYTRLDYENGFDNTDTVIGQNERDVEISNYTGRLGYEFSPGYSAFVKSVTSDRNYYHDGSSNNRDSIGYRGTAGISAELTNLVVGEIETGYTYRDYDNFKNIGSFVYGAAINWYPTPLLTARFNIDKDIMDSADISGTNTSGIDQTTYSTELNYELLRNMIITPRLSYSDGQYNGANDYEKLYTAGISTDYFLNRNVALRAGYEYGEKQSSISALEYDRNLFTLALKTKI